MTKGELRSIMKSMLKEEIKGILKEELERGSLASSIKDRIKMYAPMIVKEMVEDTLDETLSKLYEQKQSGRNASLREHSLSDTLSFDSSDVHTLGMRRALTQAAPTKRYKNTITMVHGASDAPIATPIDPSQVPTIVQDAMNKDYRSMLRAMNVKKSSVVSPLPNVSEMPVAPAPDEFAV